MMLNGLATKIKNRAYSYLVPYTARRKNKVYRNTRKLINDSEQMTREELDGYHLIQLRDLIEYCRVNVPFYTELFSEHNVDEYHIKTLDDIRRIPILTKNILKENLSRLVTVNDPFNEKKVYSTTGGTTGEPVGFYSYSKRLQSIENAFVDDIWEQSGYHPGDMIAVMRGAFIDRPADDGFHWRKYHGDPHLYLSIFSMRQEDAKHYSSLMTRYNAEYLHCFPSSAKTFFKLLKASGSPIPQLRGIFTSSESLTEADRDFIEIESGASILDLYGASERVVIAGECRCCGQYHVYPQYGYFELLDEQGNLVTSEGGTGSIIGTSYGRYATPLIRYEVGDMAVLGRTKGKCSRNYISLCKILGRSVDYAISSTGREVSMSMINMHTREFDPIIRFQFQQREEGELEFHFMAACDLTEQQLSAMRAFIQSKLGGDFNLHMVARDDIPRCKNGKHKLIVHKS